MFSQNFASGNLLTQDLIRQGSVSTFSGHSDAKELFWVVLPIVLLTLAVVVVFATTEAKTNIWYFLCMASDGPLTEESSTREGVCLYALRQLFKPMQVLAVCCILLMILNAVAPSIYEANYGCVDPLLAVTTALVQSDPLYQYLWTAMSCV